MSLKVESAPGFMGPVQCSVRNEEKEKRARRPGWRAPRRNRGLGFNLAGGGVPGDRGAAEIGFVGHVASQRGVVAEDGILGHLLMVLGALEEFPEMWLNFVPRDALVRESFRERLLAGGGIMLGVEFLEVFLP